MDRRILIIGAGNTVMADEGIGPRCLEALQEWFDFADNIELADVGTMGISLLDALRAYSDLIVLDAAIETGHPAGTVILYGPEDLAQHQVLHSAHDMRFVDVLKSAKLMGIELDSVAIVAVQIKDMTQWVMDLSPDVEAAIPIACACAMQLLDAIGGTYTPKPDAGIPPDFYDALKNYTTSIE
ncbi:MAG: hydrogenase maturation protease [Actinomycetia bacterium]|nr:hydrogenase maturation protease [Actinomycetes bacterium]